VLPREIIPKTHGVCRAPSAPAATPTPTAVPAVAATAGQLMAASRGTTAAWERRSSELRAPNEAQAAATTATSRKTNSTATADIDRARARATRYSDRRADNATTATAAATATTTTTSRSRPTQLNRSQTPHAKPATTNPRTAQKIYRPIPHFDNTAILATQRTKRTIYGSAATTTATRAATTDAQERREREEEAPEAQQRQQTHNEPRLYGCARARDALCLSLFTLVKPPSFAVLVIRLSPSNLVDIHQIIKPH